MSKSNSINSKMMMIIIIIMNSLLSLWPFKKNRYFMRFFQYPFKNGQYNGQKKIFMLPSHSKKAVKVKVIAEILKVIITIKTITCMTFFFPKINISRIFQENPLKLPKISRMKTNVSNVLQKCICLRLV